MSTLPTGTVTFLFTDLEGYTQRCESLPDAMRADLPRHDALLHAAIARNGGSVFKTVGDAFCAVFPTAQQGLKAALAAQQALHAQTWAVGGAGLNARMALHTGEAEERDGDYFGRAVNRTARLCDAAHGGQTVLSQAAEQLVRDGLPAGASLRDLGPHRLKDLLRPEQVFQLLHPDLPGDFPPLRSLNRFPHNLPQRLDSFIGRAAELAQVKRLLASCRLLTLTGVGGAGKTRLSQQAAAESLERFPEGVWLVPLEALTDPALIPQAVAAAVGVREQPGQPLTATLCETLRARKVLLLLDNCEHLIGHCAHFAQTVLQACPQVQILATSREALSISGEACFPVPTLPVPDPRRDTPSGEPPEVSEAMRLFADRAAQSVPSFALTPENSRAVARICGQLDGIPLAIELAAPRVRMLTLDQISQRLDKRFRLLTGGSRTALPRRQTMLATIQWSHDLLSESERGLFRRLSVFAGGWTLEAAEQVCSGDGLEEGDVLEVLSCLVSKSLVLSDEENGGEHRYRMLETLRQYSWELLLAAPGFDAVRDRHQSYYLSLAEQAEIELRGPQQGAWLDRLEAEHDNFRAVLAWPTDVKVSLRLAAALLHFWLTRGYLNEGREWLEKALAVGGAAVSAKALSAAGVLAWSQGEYVTARTFQEHALAVFQEKGDTSGVARTLLNLGIVADYEQDYHAAYSHYSSSLDSYRKLGDARHTALALLNIAAHLIEQNLHTAAEPLLEESLSLLKIQDDRTSIATALYDQGQIACKQQRWQEANAKFCESLLIRRELQDRQGIASCLFYMARLADAVRQYERCATLLGAAQAIRSQVGVPMKGSEWAEHTRLAAELPFRLGTTAYEEASVTGANMDSAAAVRFALQKGGCPIYTS